MNITDEERNRRRSNALELISEGKLGGAAFGRLGGRPRNPRASERVAQRVAGDGDMIYERLKEIVEDGSNTTAIASALALLKIEDNERKIEENEEMKFEQLRRNELIEFIADSFKELQDQGVITGGVIEAEFVELVDRPIEGTSVSTESA
jgi:hypothetical protein